MYLQTPHPHTPTPTPTPPLSRAFHAFRLVTTALRRSACVSPSCLFLVVPLYAFLDFIVVSFIYLFSFTFFFLYPIFFPFSRAFRFPPTIPPLTLPPPPPPAPSLLVFRFLSFFSLSSEEKQNTLSLPSHPILDPPFPSHTKKTLRWINELGHTAHKKIEGRETLRMMPWLATHSLIVYTDTLSAPPPPPPSPPSPRLSFVWCFFVFSGLAKKIAPIDRHFSTPHEKCRGSSCFSPCWRW